MVRRKGSGSIGWVFAMCPKPIDEENLQLDL